MGPLTLNPADPPEELARQILLQADRTTPLDPRSTGLMPLLEGAPDQRDLGKYIQMFRLVASKTSDPLVRLRAQAEVLQAERRDPEADIEPIIDNLVQAEEALIESAEIIDPAFANYLSGVMYNRGIALRAPYRYIEAGNAQALSAIWAIAAGEPVKVLTALFIAAVEEATQAICSQNDEEMNMDVLDVRLRHLRDVRTHVERACETLGVTYPGWMAANADIHVWLVHTLAQQDYPERRADEEAILARDSKSPHWAACVKGIRALDDGRLEDALAITQSSIHTLESLQSSSVNNALLLLKLERAYTLYKLGDDEAYQTQMQEISRWAGNDGLAVVNAAACFPFPPDAEG